MLQFSLSYSEVPSPFDDYQMLNTQSTFRSEVFSGGVPGFTQPAYLGTEQLRDRIVRLVKLQDLSCSLAFRLPMMATQNCLYLDRSPD